MIDGVTNEQKLQIEFYATKICNLLEQCNNSEVKVLIGRDEIVFVKNLFSNPFKNKTTSE